MKLDSYGWPIIDRDLVREYTLWYYTHREVVAEILRKLHGSS